MKILTVIGNGFDLGHKLPTRFNDFIESNKTVFSKKYGVFCNGENNWNDIEEMYGELLCDVIAKREEFYIVDEVDSIIQNYGFNEYGEVDYYNYRSDAFEEENQKIYFYINLLRQFEKDFHNYLKENCSKEEILKCNRYNNVQKIISLSDKIITFNYTYTPEILYRAKEVIHIHGDINHKISIGCGSLENAKDTAIDDRYPTMNMFEKNKHGFQEMLAYYEDDMDGGWIENHFIKRFFDEVSSEIVKREKETFDLLDKKNKNTLSLRKKIIKEIEQEKYDEIYILGHSLGRADKEFFQALNPNAKFFYYYFGDLHSESNVVTSKTIDVFNWNCEWISSENLYI